MAQAASYCPTHPHLYRYLGRRLGRYTFLQPLLSIRPGEGVQVSGGTWCPRKHVPPPQNFPGLCRGFPLWCLSPGVFLPFGLLPPFWTCTFFGQRGERGPPPFFETPLYVPGTNPTPFERLGMRDLRPPLGSTRTKVGLLLQGCTIVVAATHGGGAAAP